MNSKDRLLLQCTDVQHLLLETLRYRYNKNITTKDFYEECDLRLGYLRNLIGSLREDDEAGLHAQWLQLNYLSELITMIERSHLEEFSWPFAEALKRSSNSVCNDVLFFFRAEGGLCSYAVRPEINGPGVFKRRIHPVVFPRALKDSVLLHTIIGHEFGHAAFASHPGVLQKISEKLLQDSVASSPTGLFEWCAANIGTRYQISDAYMAQQRAAWAKEFFCDLFGLLTMGPSFLAAFQAVLETPTYIGPKNPTLVMPGHPPFASRVVVLLQAARALNLLYSEQHGDIELQRLSTTLDNEFTACAHRSPAQFAILNSQRVGEASIDLLHFMQTHSSLPFPAPDTKLLSELIRSIDDAVPPAGRYPQTVGTTPSGNSLLAECSTIDFRHILFAGWLSWLGGISDKNDEHFGRINHLCSHAIMQQEGIAYWMERKAEMATNVR